MPERVRCPDCGTELVSEGGVAGLCPQCLLSLALKDSPAASEGDATVDETRSDTLVPQGRLAAGRVLGERYQIREFLGRGGMGEVFRAFDLKLRVDVALKAVRPGRLGESRARDRLRREVRAAREVVSPNVCRIFDLVDEDGQELVSMEYVDGETLAETLRRGGPLALDEAREIASQFLAGLEAIHHAGLVHRDFKPENVMLTRAGRVVVMDFGLAKLASRELAGTAAGTPAYMAPEQMHGQPVDARADVFAAGVVLAEMVSAGGPDLLEARRELWRGVRETPPRVPEGPWEAVLRQCLSPSPAERPASARALARALDELTARLPGVETKRPYPGLASFTERDEEYFHGREVEIEAVCRKLKRPRMVALVGPSGAGKSSFLRAGILPALPSSWATLVTTPGTRPLQALAQALAPHLASDPQAVQHLVRFEDADASVGLVSRWRRRHEHAVVAVDQFEELFTQNPPPVQAKFAALLGRLVLEADAHVVLSLRDDFLIHCHAHEALAPILSDLTLVGPLSESGLHRALVQPALSCGYRFEDEALVEEMLAAVRGERGALPLLAFAASRLWDLRDRERGLLTWEACRQIGGVAGALAQHAEATLARIGAPRTPLVRELFRNLVTAEGTRAAQERGELLSVFDEAERSAAGEVLDALVDARLLTRYEEGGASRQTVEIVHESLLNAWPRLVRWRTQDADGAQLRDQLRQAARLWDERGRPEDLLWTGSAYRDLAVWRERYSGGLAATEQDFASAAARLSGRRRRRRRIAATAAIVTAATVAVTTTTLWRKSEGARRRTEAAEILALGRLMLEDYPTAALAHAIASLEGADNAPARRFAVEALWKGPPVTVLAGEPVMPFSTAWSPDGTRLALGGSAGLVVLERDAARRLQLATTAEHPAGFSEDGTRLLTATQGNLSALHLWSIPEGRLIRTWPEAARRQASLRGRKVLTFTFTDAAPAGETTAQVDEFAIDGGAEKSLGLWRARDLSGWAVDPSGETVFSIQGGRLLEHRLGALDRPPNVLAKHAAASVCGAWPGRVVTSDADGSIRMWDTETRRLERTLRAPADARRVALDPVGRYLASRPGGGPLPPRSFYLFDLAAPSAAQPQLLLQKELDWINGIAFHPRAPWLATGLDGSILLWNLATRRSRVLHGQRGFGLAVAFTADGRLVSTSDEGVARLWPLASSSAEKVRELWSQPGATLGYSLAVDADRAAIVSKRFGAEIMEAPLDGSRARIHRLQRGKGRPTVWATTLDPMGRTIAFGYGEVGNPAAASIRLLDRATGHERKLEVSDAAGACDAMTASLGRWDVPAWLPDGRLVSNGATGLRVWDLATGGSRQIQRCRPSFVGAAFFVLRAAADGRTVVTLVGGRGRASPSELTLANLESGESRTVTSHGARLSAVALERTGRLLVTGDLDGLVRVGPLSGDEPHLLYGHTRAVTSVAVSPDGRWIASGSEDDTIRLWPMPAGPPLHTLPYEELLAKLRALTNLRIVTDPASARGYKVQPGPFPGWAVLPTW